jgi:glycosyltransferase involved in cell wall biosynthesis
VATFVNPLPAKGLDIVLALAAGRPDIPFEFVESWPLRPAEEASLAARLATLPNVTLTRRCSDMREVYGRCRVLLAPSRWIESWGRVASEAQISGIPVIAARRGGLPEAVGPGGILVDPDAPLSAWEAALATLWDDPAAHRRYEAAALAHAARPEMAPDALLDRFIAAVEGHLAAAGGPPPRR